MSFPENPRRKDELLDTLRALQADDIDWRRGRAFAFTYISNDAVSDIAESAYSIGFSTNGLSRRAFPSLGRLEDDVVSMMGDLFHLPGAFGSMTSGGTESILLSVISARASWIARHGDLPGGLNIVLPQSAHPAFHKAAELLGLEERRVKLTASFEADADAMAGSADQRTVLLVGSAPSYPHGIMDPIPAIAAVALEMEIPLHVDACIGGLIVPFSRDLGHEVPDFDFSLAGVSSMSADLHKYGFAAKGASVLLHRTRDALTARSFEFSGWNGGTYKSPGLLGTRPGGAIASAWAVLQGVARPGYIELARDALAATDALQRGIKEIMDYRIVGDPAATLFAFTSPSLDMARVATHLMDMGWAISLEHDPECIHMTVSPGHRIFVDEFLRDLQISTSHSIGANSEVSSSQAPEYN